MSGPAPDADYMHRALDLARAQLGRTAPNPAVGCVIVTSGAIVGEGATGAGGRPHAEEIALGMAGEHARGATAYVTLEPCSERSSGSASCSQLLLTAGLARIVIACPDPHPLGSQGIERLKAAGIRTELGPLQTEAMALNAGFFKLVALGRPLLSIDEDGARHDAEFDLAQHETYERALDRMGAAGLTRVYVRPGTALAAQLKARGLVDIDGSSDGSPE